MAVTKPKLNIEEALHFATGGEKKEKPGNPIGKQNKSPKKALKSVDKDRVFFAPKGDKRLTINLKEELHKKLKIVAIEQGITAGELIEELIKEHL